MAAEPVLVGVSADPSQGTEDWSDDFFFPSPSGGAKSHAGSFEALSPQLLPPDPPQLQQLQRPDSLRIPVVADGEDSDDGAWDDDFGTDQGTNLLTPEPPQAKIPDRFASANGAAEDSDDGDEEDWDTEFGFSGGSSLGRQQSDQPDAFPAQYGPSGAALLGGQLLDSDDLLDIAERALQAEVETGPLLVGGYGVLHEPHEVADWEREAVGASDSPETTRAIMAKGFRLLLKGSLGDAQAGNNNASTASVTGQASGAVPDSCRLADKLLRGDPGQTVRIIRYPRACHLVTLKALEGQGRAMHGPALIEWLTTLVQRHVAADAAKDARAQRRASAEVLLSLEAKSARLDVTAAHMLLESCAAAVRAGDDAAALNVTWRYLRVLDQQHRPSAAVAESARRFGGDPDDHSQFALLRLTLQMLELVALRPNLYERSGVRADGAGGGGSTAAAKSVAGSTSNPHLRGAAELRAPVRPPDKPPPVAASAAQPAAPGSFAEMLRTACQVFPAYRDCFALLELRAVAHHFREIVQAAEAEADDSGDGDDVSEGGSGEDSCATGSEAGNARGQQRGARSANKGEGRAGSARLSLRSRPGHFLWVAQTADKLVHTKLRYLAQTVCANYLELYARASSALQSTTAQQRQRQHHAHTQSGFVRPPPERQRGSAGGSTGGGGGARPGSVRTDGASSPGVTHLEAAPLFLQVSALSDLCLVLMGVSPLNLEEMTDVVDFLPSHHENAMWDMYDDGLGSSARQGDPDSLSGYSSGGDLDVGDDLDESWQNSPSSAAGGGGGASSGMRMLQATRSAGAIATAAAALSGSSAAAARVRAASPEAQRQHAAAEGSAPGAAGAAAATEQGGAPRKSSGDEPMLATPARDALPSPLPPPPGGGGGSGARLLSATMPLPLTNASLTATAAAATDAGVLSGGDGESPRSSHLAGEGMRLLDARCRGIREGDDAEPYLEMLLPAYRQLAEGCALKARAAFALGLLASAARKLELAASLHLEAVLVLDRLPVADTGHAPLVTPEGMHCLEKLGDVLLRGGKYDYGILALERAIDCYLEVALHRVEHDKLIRRVTRLTVDHGDVRRALEYHVRMLRRAKQGGNVNEFVYLAKELSRMLVDQGWFTDAEQYLRVASRLVAGTPLDKVYIRERGGGRPTVEGLMAPNATAGYATLSSLPVSSGSLDTINYSVPFLECLDGGAGAQGGWGPSMAAAAGGGGAVGSGGYALGSDGGRSMDSAHGETLRQRDRERDRRGATGVHSETSTPMDRGGYVGFDSDPLVQEGNGDMGGSAAGPSAVMDTQQYEVQMKLAEVLSTSLQFGKAVRLLHRLLRSRLVASQRSAIYMRLAHCYLKTRRLTAAEISLERVQLEADEALEVFASLGITSNSANPTTKDHKYSSGEWRRMLGGGADANKVGSMTSLTSVVAVVKSTEFLVLRAKCRLAADDPATALYWANIALAVCADSHQTNHMVLGRLHYLRARCLQRMVKRSWEDAIAGGAALRKPVGFAVESAACGPPPAWQSEGGEEGEGDADYFDEDGNASSRKSTWGEEIRRSSSLGAGGGAGGRAAQGSGAGAGDADCEEPELESDGSRMRTGSPSSVESSYAGSRAGASVQQGEAASRPWVPEAELADMCEAAFLQSQGHYRSADDIYYQGKCLARIAEMHLCRVFKHAALSQPPRRASTPGGGRGSTAAAAAAAAEEATAAAAAVLDEQSVLLNAEVHAAAALELAGDLASPLLLVLCLLNMAELHWLQGRPAPAYQAWKEAQALLNMTFLQRQDAKEYAAMHTVPRKMRAGAAGAAPLTGTLNVSARGRGRSQSSSPNRLPHAPTQTASPPKKSTWPWEQAQPQQQRGRAQGHEGGAAPPPPDADPQQRQQRRPTPTPMGMPSLPTVLHSPSTLVRVYGLLSRVVRMSFMMAGTPPVPSLLPSHSFPVVLASALPNHTHLLAGWQYLDSEVRQYQGLTKGPLQSAVAGRRQHRRAQRHNAAESIGSFGAVAGIRAASRTPNAGPGTGRSSPAASARGSVGGASTAGSERSAPLVPLRAGHRQRMRTQPGFMSQSSIESLDLSRSGSARPSGDLTLPAAQALSLGVRGLSRIDSFSSSPGILELSRQLSTPDAAALPPQALLIPQRISSGDAHSTVSAPASVGREGGGRDSRGGKRGGLSPPLRPMDVVTSATVVAGVADAPVTAPPAAAAAAAAAAAPQKSGTGKPGKKHRSHSIVGRMLGFGRSSNSAHAKLNKTDSRFTTASAASSSAPSSAASSSAPASCASTPMGAAAKHRGSAQTTTAAERAETVPEQRGTSVFKPATPPLSRMGPKSMTSPGTLSEAGGAGAGSVVSSTGGGRQKGIRHFVKRIASAGDKERERERDRERLAEEGYVGMAVDSRSTHGKPSLPQPQALLPGVPTVSAHSLPVNVRGKAHAAPHPPHRRTASMLASNSFASVGRAIEMTGAGKRAQRAARAACQNALSREMLEISELSPGSVGMYSDGDNIGLSDEDLPFAPALSADASDPASGGRGGRGSLGQQSAPGDVEGAVEGGGGGGTWPAASARTEALAKRASSLADGKEGRAARSSTNAAAAAAIDDIGIGSGGGGSEFGDPWRATTGGVGKGGGRYGKGGRMRGSLGEEQEGGKQAVRRRLSLITSSMRDKALAAEATDRFIVGDLQASAGRRGVPGNAPTAESSPFLSSRGRVATNASNKSGSQGSMASVCAAAVPPPPTGLDPALSPQRRALWTCFCLLKQATRKYSAGKVSLRDLRAMNIAIMQQIVQGGRGLGRPVSRSDKHLAADGKERERRAAQLATGQQHLSAISAATVVLPATPGMGAHAALHGGGAAALSEGWAGFASPPAAHPAAANIHTASTTDTMVRPSTAELADGGSAGGADRGNRDTSSASLFGSSMDATGALLNAGGGSVGDMGGSAALLGGSVNLAPSIRGLAAADSVNSGPGSGSTPTRSSRRRAHGQRRLRNASSTPSIKLRCDSFTASSSTAAGTPAAASKASVAATYESALAPLMGSRALRCRLHTYPPTFAFVLHVEQMYLYYAPATGDTRVIVCDSCSVPPLVPPSDDRTLAIRPQASADDAPCSAAAAAAAAAPPPPPVHTSTTPPLPPSPFTDGAAERRYDEVLMSIGKGAVGGVLPLVPRADREGGADDKALALLIETLTPQFALFLVTALLLEQPVLLVASPGSEEDMMHIETALLRLLRPFEWQYMSVPLCHQGSAHVLRHAVESKEPFLIGTYPSVLEALCPAGLRVPASVSDDRFPDRHSGVRAGAKHAHGGGGRAAYHSPGHEAAAAAGGMDGGSGNINMRAVYGGLGGGAGGGVGAIPLVRMSHVTVVDLDLGVIHPSKFLEYAAATTMHATYAPDADTVLRGMFSPSLQAAAAMGARDAGDRGSMDTRGSGGAAGGAAARRPSIGSDADTQGCVLGQGPWRSAAKGMLPPLPPRYRHRLGQKMERVLVEGPGSPYGATLNAMARTGSGPHLAGLVGMVGGRSARANGGGKGGGAEHGKAAGGKTSPQTSPNTAGTSLPSPAESLPMRLAECLRVEVFNIMISLLKPYHLFLRKPPGHRPPTPHPSSDHSQSASGDAPRHQHHAHSGGSSTQGTDPPEFLADAFLDFVKADTRSFLAHVLRTKAFGAFLRWTGRPAEKLGGQHHPMPLARSASVAVPHVAADIAAALRLQAMQQQRALSGISTASNTYAGGHHGASSTVPQGTPAHTATANSPPPASSPDSLFNMGGSQHHLSPAGGGGSIASAATQQQQRVPSLLGLHSGSASGSGKSIGAGTVDFTLSETSQSPALSSEPTPTVSMFGDRSTRSSIAGGGGGGGDGGSSGGGGAPAPSRHHSHTLQALHRGSQSHSLEGEGGGGEGGVVRQPPVLRPPPFPFRELFESEVRTRMRAKLAHLDKVYQVNEGRISLWVLAYFTDRRLFSPKATSPFAPAAGASQAPPLSAGGSNVVSPAGSSFAPGSGGRERGPLSPTESVASTIASTIASTRRGASPARSGSLGGGARQSGGGGGGGSSKPPKVKRRWCILDATKLSYYRSRSKTRVKGYIPFEPASVSLVTPPFAVHSGHATTEHDCVALVWNQEAAAPGESVPGTLVIRAEDMTTHRMLVRALKAKLTPREHLTMMRSLYGDSNP
ncbi:hypothetical protein JKP88DRAFT_310417 [Tribonema minus]|uniref:cDENN domain-containing protein n=1 Tax=Tribonema minus TaxID=303371 RepID=A0A836CI77_9STRA|nr:hypothetical protein JKP88DRAFT_310417 [Tribonema minus]